MTRKRDYVEGAAYGAGAGVAGSASLRALQTLPKAKSMAAHGDAHQRNIWATVARKKGILGKPVAPMDRKKMGVHRRAFIREAVLQEASKAPKLKPAVGGAVLGAAYLANKRRSNVYKRNMSQAEINHRKKVQGVSSQVTGTLGLTALGGTLLATKRGGAATKKIFEVAGKQRPAYLKPKNLKNKTAPLLATSAGIGGVSAYNFAAYSKAEARQRKRPVVKSLEFNIPVDHGEAAKYFEEVAKFDADIEKYYDPEGRRLKRADRYESVADAVAGASLVGAAHQGNKARKMIKLVPKNNFDAKYVSRTGIAHGGKAAALAAGAAGAAGVSQSIKRRKRPQNSWDMYR